MLIKFPRNFNNLKMKKYLIPLLSLLFISTTWGAQINLAVNKTNLTTDDVLELTLSVDGEIDNGQVGLKGLDDFEIIGQSTSQQVQIINGKTSAVLEKIIDLKPKKGGEFIIQALAKKDGKLVKSQEFKIKVQKSLIQQTKENLLANPVAETEKKSNSDQEENQTKNPAKKLLTMPSQTSGSEKNNAEKLNIKELPPLPPVQHFSAFNKIFWLEFLGILTLLIVIFRGIFFFKKKIYSENK